MITQPFSLPHSLATSIPSYLPPSLLPSLPPSLNSSPFLSLSSSDPPSSVSASYNNTFPVFPILSHSSVLVYTPLPKKKFPATRFLLILSFLLSRTLIRSWLFAHMHTNVEAIYVIQSNCVMPAMLHWHYHSLTQTMQSVNWCWTF